mmetsp:Transcript_1791/g.2431  ORF Transcript_1791/g.2431 Transcript_1791/m.2431 type:complete len:655 (+) Transcript_1791:100-2064(+)|eukprot:CAMPEP_0117755824 /NCGR_PEP_ID=MMETSP0947-20121206/13680_1 /TAXON_ID=44440 /ORGANISM="Chattonella subsalsa, Strain CCMP2191" /LENGTH=654 /DNA_ID=CAMNT_0005575229 /DNA_START=18 /DNA_END=1982 /DNA_ORIENTATION=-
MAAIFSVKVLRLLILCLLIFATSIEGFNLDVNFQRSISLCKKSRITVPPAKVLQNNQKYEVQQKENNKRKNYYDQDELDELWVGQMEGFDWELEKARRFVFGDSSSQGYAPFRMDFWKPLPAGQSEKKVTLLDSLYILFSNIMQFFFGAKSLDGAPVAEIQPYTGSFSNFVVKALSGNLEELAGGPLFLLLEKYYKQYGPVFKLAFGPRSFIVISDPVMAKHILRKNPLNYDKGVLADILSEIMGKGLIPADPETWKVRRKAIVPGFHNRWLNRMIQLFVECNQQMFLSLDKAVESKKPLDMETMFCSVSLDIIGRAVFNYEFGSVTNESPVVKCVYSTLREAEHRSTSFVPYWKIPVVKDKMKSQVAFKENMKILNDILDELIFIAHSTAVKADIEELEQRDSDDPSLLRFLVDMRGEDASSRQLRDDLMTMLIAGHETTAAVLTWSLFNLAQKPEILEEVRAEIEEVIGDRAPTYEDLPKLKMVRYVLIEALRLYPEPPLLIRRALEDDVLPKGGSGIEVKLPKGTDVFISTWNLHRSPEYWENPESFDPHRWERPFQNLGVEGWEGYNPAIINGLYPSEIAADFAFLPFGGGSRKCVGDQFAMMESCVTLAMLLHRYDFEFADGPDHVGMKTGATIHTENGLNMYIKKRGQ